MRENPDNLVGAIVETTLAAMSGPAPDLSLGFVLRFGKAVLLSFRDIGTFLVPAAKSAFPARKYTVSQNVIEIAGMYLCLFYKKNHIVILRLPGEEYLALTKALKKPVVPVAGDLKIAIARQ